MNSFLLIFALINANSCITINQINKHELKSFFHQFVMGFYELAINL